ncbi:TIGR03087 family PEP-CTERM/XrtA system glycosyltransferase [Novosphingobium sp.]|uniref:TIGR03087 family PEP-CTERM/XrtA system glycosyltransferase n=1 Tax=Novosphingobium sp. TaxID=1874826 RepID=UPI001D1E14CD|nr:TIGR03087 family PEP-CTERM/XrtA system glycosyltransferase [Novosphingobium sp.]MBX9663515.1 TIGR03087 family PEP-CTERM/XrtA system glycosyltransferase [Novosphingobium sp.]
MSEVLFLAHRVPFPPDRGDKIRSNHLLRRIAEMAPVHVGALADDAADLAQESAVAAIATSHCIVRRSAPLPLAALAALGQGLPVSLAAFASAKLQRWVHHVLETRPISAIFVFSGQMAQYVPGAFRGRVVMDFVDVDSAKFEAYAQTGALPRRLLYAREARLLRRFEEMTARRATTSLFVSREERALFESRLSGSARPDVRALGNGIDTELFDPAAVVPAPELAGGGPNIVFTGQMDYPPNITAVELFAHEVMPRIRAVHPEARFAIVGRAPTAAVRALEGVGGTLVTGAVPDVRPWLAGADLVTAPLLIARGVQNKVLEAMAMARPVLLTPAAATGISAADGEHFALAEAPLALADRALALLADQAAAHAMGLAARRFVIAECGWDRVLAPLRALISGLRESEADAA